MNTTALSVHIQRGAASAAIAFLAFEMLLRGLGEDHLATLWLATFLGGAGMVYFRVMWARRLLSARLYALLAAVVPLGLALVGVYVRTQLT